MTKNRRYKTPEEAFAARTEWRGECLVWTGCTNRDGYGYLQVDGRQEGAHRFAHIRVNGPIPKGLVIDHMCHNRACCNVLHLRAVTQGENTENSRGPRKGSVSGYLNVSWESTKAKWCVRVRHAGTRYQGGYFACKEEANRAAIALRAKLRTKA